MSQRRYLTYILLLLPVISFLSCTSATKQYRIGVSQCSNDIWRDKQNDELRMGAYFHNNVELLFTTADDSDARQVQQIDSLVNQNIDLLIVAPNQVGTISPAIDRAYDKGIPVIVFERKTDSKKYTAYMGADNYEMGKLMGEYVASRLHHQGEVVEVMGLKGSSPAIERHNGFTEALGHYPGIHVVATLQGDWTEPSAYSITQEWLAAHPNEQVDLVFGMNDRMAMGARKAFLTPHPSPLTPHPSIPLFCGIDGLPGKGGGIQLVRDSLLDASYIYPTHGDQLLQLAVDILEGRPYKKETSLMSAIVTQANARVLQLEGDEVIRQTQYVQQLHAMATGYLQRLSSQRMVIFLSIGIIVLLLLLVIGIRYYHRQKVRIAQERGRLQRKQLDFYTQVSHELRTPVTLIAGPLDQLAQTPEMRQASASTADMLDIIRRNVAHLSVLVNKIFDVQMGKNTQDMTPNEIDELIVNQAREAHDMRLNEVYSDESLTLLVVDDNADIRSYLRTILLPHYKVIEAADGQQALALAQEEVPDLILSDVMMPVMNGLDFCKQVKSNFVTSHIPVILVTARAMDQHQVEGYQSGADAYLTKPFVAEVLLARIDNLLKSRSVLKNLWAPNPQRPDTDSSPRQEGEGAPSSSNTQPASQEHAPEQEAAPVPLEPDSSSAPFNADSSSAPASFKPAPSTGPVSFKADSIRLSPNPENAFITRFKKVVEERMDDNDLSVETIASELALSRVQLYRKVKALTGSTPVDLLRKARLNKARQLLTQTDQTVSEIAYRVGFTSPSYFTKCFKDEYGIVPGDARQ